MRFSKAIHAHSNILRHQRLHAPSWGCRWVIVRDRRFRAVSPPPWPQWLFSRALRQGDVIQAALGRDRLARTCQPSIV